MKLKLKQFGEIRFSYLSVDTFSVEYFQAWDFKINGLAII